MRMCQSLFVSRDEQSHMGANELVLCNLTKLPLEQCDD